MGNGGIGGTGIFGMIGTVVQCKAEDTSLYCSLAKLVNTIFMLFILAAILYFLWTFIRSNINGGSKGLTGGYISKQRKSRSPSA